MRAPLTLTASSRPALIARRKVGTESRAYSQASLSLIHGECASLIASSNEVRWVALERAGEPTQFVTARSEAVFEVVEL